MFKTYSFDWLLKITLIYRKHHNWLSLSNHYKVTVFLLFLYHADNPYGIIITVFEFTDHCICHKNYSEIVEQALLPRNHWHFLFWMPNIELGL